MPVVPRDAYPFAIRRSSIQGQGAFATRRIRKGERIIEYTGERITNAEADRRYDDERMSRHHTYLFTLTQRTVVDGGRYHRSVIAALKSVVWPITQFVM